MGQSNTMYNLVVTTIDGMEIGESKTIDLPVNMPYFRKYLSEISKRTGRKFTTKVNSEALTLDIMRIKYSNIYSKELE